MHELAVAEAEVVQDLLRGHLRGNDAIFMKAPPQHLETPRARGPQLVHVHGLEVTEPALDLLLADGRELDGELEPALYRR